MLLNRAVPFRYFLLANPDRVVIDLAERQRLPKGGAAVRGGLIRDLRYGRFQPHVDRLVLDLKEPAVVRRAEMIDRGRSGAELVLELARADQAIFLNALRRGQVQGTLVVATRKARARFSGVPLPQIPPLPTTLSTLPPGGAARSAPSFRPPQPVAPPSSRPRPSAAPAAGPNFQRLRARKPVIVIDPGHGGKDPGTTGPGGIEEKVITLAMAKELARELIATGRYRVRLTRSSDVFVSLPQRVAIADKDRADLFISLHCNWIKDKAIHGLAIYTLSGKASDRETAMLAHSENSVDFVNGVNLHERDFDVANILLSLAQREATNRAVMFARDVVQAVGPRTLLEPDPHRSADFRVLIDPDVPSVLIEMAYLSNPNDERHLLSPIWRAQLGGRLVAAVNQYFAGVHD